MNRYRRTVTCCLASLMLLTATACANKESSTVGDVTDLSSSLSETVSQDSAPDSTQPSGESSETEESRGADGTTGAWQSEPPTSDGSTAAGAETQTAAQTVTDAQGQTTASGAAQTTASTTAKSITEIGSASALYGDNITAKAGAKHVPVTVSIKNNPGISFMGIRLSYDAALTPVFADGLLTEYVDGTVTKGVMSTCAANSKKLLLGYSAAAAANLTEDGSLFTCYFDLPDNAKPGTVYQFRLESKDVSNADGKVFTFEYLPFTLTVQ